MTSPRPGVRPEGLSSRYSPRPSRGSAFAGNPLDFGSNIKTADPSGHVWADGRMYIYASHDEECQEDFWMKDWHAFSSADLVNWTDHGAIFHVKDIAWADNYAWAPDAAYKNGKYYFCFPAGTGHKDRGARRIRAPAAIRAGRGAAETRRQRDG